MVIMHGVTISHIPAWLGYETGGPLIEGSGNIADLGIIQDIAPARSEFAE